MTAAAQITIEFEATPEIQPVIIKGCSGGPEGKWDEVQAIQHEPFIYIEGNGSKWAGQEEDDISVLLEVLAKHKLDPFWGPYFEVNPCEGEINPNRSTDGDAPKWIDGPRLYACEGVVRFQGNFVTLSHGFCIDTNHKPTIDALMSAIAKNDELGEDGGAQ